MVNRNIRALQFLVIFIIVLISVMSMMYPEQVKYVYSIKDVGAKKGEMKSLKSEIVNNEKLIEDKILKLNNEERSAIREEREAKSLEGKIDERDLKIHIPSILITLEQNALKENIKLIIETENIETFDGGKVNVTQKFGGERDLTNKDKEEKEDEDENESDKGGKSEIDIKEKEESTKNKFFPGPSKSPENKSTITLIPGINTTMIPIRILGKYDEIKNFIKFIDDIDFMEPSVVTLFSKEDEVRGYIVLQIFHKGGA